MLIKSSKLFLSVLFSFLFPSNTSQTSQTGAQQENRCWNGYWVGTGFKDHVVGTGHSESKYKVLAQIKIKAGKHYWTSSVAVIVSFC
jgi:hypothetical protein